MTITIDIVRQPLGNDQMIAGELSRRVGRFLDNPKHVAAWAIASMAEASIDMTEGSASIADVESDLTAANMRERAKDFVEDMLQELRDAVHEAIQDPNFCQVIVNGVNFQRNTHTNKMYVDDVDVRLDFDFGDKRR